MPKAGEGDAEGVEAAKEGMCGDSRELLSRTWRVIRCSEEVQMRISSFHATPGA